MEICCLILCFPFPTHKSPPVELMKLEHSQELHGSYGIRTTWNFITRKVIMPLMSARKNNDFSAAVSEEEVTTHLVTTVLVLRAGLELMFLVSLHHSQAPIWLCRDWISACYGEHNMPVFDWCDLKNCFWFNECRARTNEGKATLSLLVTFSVF